MRPWSASNVGVPGRRSGANLSALGLLFGTVLLMMLSPPAHVASTNSPSWVQPARALPAANNSTCPELNLSTPICHVIFVFLENQNVSKVYHQGPYEVQIARKYAFADHFYSIEHYSFPAYVATTSGTVSNFLHVMNTVNVVDQLNAHSPALSWMGAMGGMNFACHQQSGTTYRSAHNPFVWYADIWNNQTYCKAHDMNQRFFDQAAPNDTVPVYTFLSPNTTDDCWKVGIPACDSFLSKWLPPLLNDTFFQSTAMFITYDEGATADLQGVNGTRGGGHVYTALISPYACKNYTSYTDYNHYNLLTTTQWLLNLPHHLNGINWTAHPPMKDMFCFSGGNVGHAVPRTAGSADVGTLWATSTSRRFGET